MKKLIALAVAAGATLAIVIVSIANAANGV